MKPCGYPSFLAIGLMHIGPTFALTVVEWSRSRNSCLSEALCMSTVVQPEVVVSCWGNPRSLGIMLGEGLREHIIAARQPLYGFDGFRCLQPWWLPYPAYLYWAEYQARNMLE